jgi:hypothetical protein
VLGQCRPSPTLRCMSSHSCPCSRFLDNPTTQQQPRLTTSDPTREPFTVLLSAAPWFQGVLGASQPSIIIFLPVQFCPANTFIIPKMFSPFLEVWDWLKGNAPRSLSIKKLKFISVHCSLLFLSKPSCFFRYANLPLG